MSALATVVLKDRQHFQPRTIAVIMAEEEMEAGRVLRVTIPVRQHIQLHKLRLMVGKNMSDVVREALDMYFEAFNAENKDGN